MGARASTDAKRAGELAARAPLAEEAVFCCCACALLTHLNKLYFLVDLGIATCLLLLAAGAFGWAQPVNFQNIVLGILEAGAGGLLLLVTLAKTDRLDRYFHFLYTYWGRGCVAVAFGVLGLGDSYAKQVVGGVVACLGLLSIVWGCVGRQSPRVLCDCTYPGGAWRVGGGAPVERQLQPIIVYQAAPAPAPAPVLQAPPAATTAAAAVGAAKTDAPAEPPVPSGHRGAAAERAAALAAAASASAPSTMAVAVEAPAATTASSSAAASGSESV